MMYSLRRRMTFLTSALGKSIAESGSVNEGRRFSTLNERLVPRFLVTGAMGQVGTELVPYLQAKVGIYNVVASDIKEKGDFDGTYLQADVEDRNGLERIVKEHGINYVVHLASLLSAVGEKNPQKALHVNTKGIQNILELAIDHKLKVYSPSTIAVFGPTTPKHKTPESTIMQPTTMYGITKVHQELLGAYYHEKYGVDFRSLRYPGIISSKALPGGGTTDYAVDIFRAALSDGFYECFISKDVALPMMYMPDCIKATWQLMMTKNEKLNQRIYNITAMSFTPEMLAKCIQKFIPNFEMRYKPDFRERIALTWPSSINDTAARRDWNWVPDFLLEDMCAHMLMEIKQQMEGKKTSTNTVDFQTVSSFSSS